MEECIFCKIVNNDIPSWKVFENEDVIAILDINPISDGHLLIVSKRHYVNVFDANPADVASICGSIPKVSNALMRATGADGLNVLINNNKVAGQAVPHLHVHLIPRRHGDNLLVRWMPMQKGEEYFKSTKQKLATELESE